MGSVWPLRGGESTDGRLEGLSKKSHESGIWGLGVDRGLSAEVGEGPGRGGALALRLWPLAVRKGTFN